MRKQAIKSLGKADLRRYLAARALFDSAPRGTVTPDALNKALGERCHPSKTGWMLKKIGFKLRSNKRGRQVVSYTLLKSPRLKGAAQAPIPREVSVAEFRKKWPLLLEALSKRQVPRITVTKRGEPFVTLTTPPTKEDKTSIFGGLKGSVIVPEGLDLTKPVFEGEIDAEMGILHR